MDTVQRVDRFPARGSMVLYVIAIVFAIAGVLALGAAGVTAVGVVVAVGLGVNAAFLTWVGRNLASGAPWARPVAILVLWALVVFGIIETLVALAQNRINIPIGTILAAFALAAPAGPIVLPDDPAERGRAQRAMAIGVLIVVAPTVLGVIAARGV